MLGGVIVKRRNFARVGGNSSTFCRKSTAGRSAPGFTPAVAVAAVASKSHHRGLRRQWGRLPRLGNVSSRTGGRATSAATRSAVEGSAVGRRGDPLVDAEGGGSVPFGFHRQRRPPLRPSCSREVDADAAAAPTSCRPPPRRSRSRRLVRDRPCRRAANRRRRAGPASRRKRPPRPRCRTAVRRTGTADHAQRPLRWSSTRCFC